MGLKPRKPVQTDSSISSRRRPVVAAKRVTENVVHNAIEMAPPSVAVIAADPPAAVSEPVIASGVTDDDAEILAAFGLFVRFVRSIETSAAN